MSYMISLQNVTKWNESESAGRLL